MLLLLLLHVILIKFYYFYRTTKISNKLIHTYYIIIYIFLNIIDILTSITMLVPNLGSQSLEATT